MKELDDVFNDEPETDEVEETETEATETDVTETEENTEGEETAETEETEVEAQAESEESEEEVPATPEPVMVPLAAKQAEKERRQRAEQRAEELERELSQYKVTDTDKPDMYEDPEAYERWVEDKARAKLAEEQSKVLEVRINESREALLEQKEDFLQKEQAFMVLAQGNPDLTQQMLSSANPAQFAYEKGEEFLNSLISPQVIKTKKPEIPVSLAKASAKGANTVEVEEEDDFDSLFADMKY